jgi:diguanylate cyclase (GGDEF)-like protein
MEQPVRRRYLLIILLVAAQATIHLWFSYRAEQSVVGFTQSEQRAQGLLVDEIRPGFPGDKAGLKPGDLIVGVDGVPIHTPGAYDSVRLRRLVAGQPSQYQILRNGAPMTLTVIPYSRFQPVKFVVCIILVFGCIILGAFCYIRNPGDPRTRVLLLIFLSFAAVDSWYVDNWLGDWPVDQAFNALYYLVDGFSYGLLTLLPFFVPERKQFLVRKPWLSLLFISPGLVWGILNIWNWELSIYRPGTEIINQGYLDTFSGYYLDVAFLGIPLVLFHTLKKASSPQVKSQAKTMLLGVTCWALLNSLVISGQKMYPDSWFADSFYATIVDIIIPISVFFAVYRHRLFNIDVLIRKGLVYTAVSSVLFAIYLLAIGVLGWLLAVFVTPGKNVSMLTNSLSTLGVGLAFIPVRRYSQRLIDRIFYRDKYNYLEVINNIFNEMPSAFSLEKLADTLVSRIHAAMRTKNLAVLIPDEEHSRYFLRSKIGEFPGTDLENRVVLVAEDALIRSLQETQDPIYGSLLEHLNFNEREKHSLALLGTRLIMPVLHQTKLVAVLLLGEKQSETWFDGDDINFLATVSRQAAMLMENARLFELATYDGLTQLMRRSAFDAILQTEGQRSRRYNRPFSLVMLDIDHFKKLNDTYGHQAGDLVLKKLAATLKASLRHTDTASRYGGEEFAILLPETSESAALVVAETLRSRIEGLDLNIDGPRAMRITASLGIYTSGLGENFTNEELYERADAALYRAKVGGRNRVEVCNDLTNLPT